MTALALTLMLAAPVPKGEEKLPPPTPEQYRTAEKNLKETGLAIYHYYKDKVHIPKNVVDAKGKPLLSWRVQLLPYIAEDKLFKEFKLDEAWDSAANKKLIGKMPKVFVPVRAKAQPGETFLRAFDGPGSLFEKGTNLDLANIPDGGSNTAMVFEAKEPTPWTKPDDMPFDPAKPVLKLLGGQFDGESHVVVGDGMVYRLSKEADERMLKFLIQRNDRMAINFDLLLAKK